MQSEHGDASAEDFETALRRIMSEAPADRYSPRPLQGIIDAPLESSYFRPVKTPVTIRLDAFVVDWFRDNARDGKYQTEINTVLRTYVLEKLKGVS
jgi:uncharacterized protein (DUF4415 family)